MSSRTDILWPILAHMALVFCLYAWLSAVRLQALRRGTATYATFEFQGGEAPDIARITRNLSNQFELPVLFYAVLILLEHFGAVMAWDIGLAWLFVAGRVLHTVVQTRSSNVQRRGQVFAISLIACLALAGHLALVAAL